MQKKLAITKKMAESGSNLPIEARIQLLEGLRIKEAEKVFGYTPEDFEIYLQLNKIDVSGVKKNFPLPIGYSAGDDDPYGPPDELDQDLKKCLKNCLNGLVVRQSSTAYQVWQFLISLCCLGSSYYYMYLAAFGAGSPLKQNLLELVFLLDVILSFFVEYIPESAAEPPVRDFKGIARHYLRGKFAKEAIPLIPLQLVHLEGLGNLFYLIKIIRLKRGFNLLHVPTIMYNIKNAYRDHLTKMVKENP